MADNFYRAFEDRHRGSRELIKARLQVYLPFVRPLLTQFPNAMAVDLGCGRGEWLEVVSSTGFRAKGVDLDEGMLKACHQLGLDVERREALDALKSLADSSIGIVSAFHVVEHISFDDVRTLITEALRVLVPGGLLIMETPNPENIVVAGSRFYMDPSHLRPLPPPLLSFAAEYAGYERVKVLRLQENAALRDQAAKISLLHVLEEVSPDYAVVAQKGGHGAVWASTAAAFDEEYGLTLQELVARHAAQAEAGLMQTEARLVQTETRLVQTEARLVQTEARLVQTEERVQAVQEAFQDALAEGEQAREALEARVRDAEAAVQQAEAALREAEAAAQQSRILAHQHFLQLEAVHASTSWRVTAPLRRVGSIARALRGNSLKESAKVALRHAARYVNRRPWLAKPALRALRRFPNLKLRLARAVSGLQLHTLQTTSTIPSDAAHLTPYGRQIYAGLRSAVARRQKGES